MKIQYVLVRWKDIRTDTGWIKGHGCNRAMSMPAILGPIVEGDQILYSNYDPQDDAFADRTRIPLGTIVSIEVLREEEFETGEHWQHE